MPSDRPVLHIVPSEPWGGIQALVPMLAKEQAARGQAVHLLCLGRGTQIRAVAAGYGLGDVSTSLAGLAAPLRLLRLLRAHPRAIVHSHCEPVWASTIIGLAAPRRWIVHAHVYPGETMRWKERVARSLQRRFVRRHIAISQSIGNALIASGVATRATLDVVPNGIAFNAVAPMTRGVSSGFTVGFVGRAVEEKGIFEFIELAALLADTRDVYFAVYGDGADLAAARRLAATRGVTERIVFHGHVSDIAAAWADIDLAIVLSKREPFGLVFLEAALHGVATISYRNTSGGSEVADTLASAYRIAPGDLPAAAAIVRSLATQGGPSPALFEQDRATIADRYGIATMARGVAAAYARLDAPPIAAAPAGQ